MINVLKESLLVISQFLNWLVININQFLDWTRTLESTSRIGFGGQEEFSIDLKYWLFGTVNMGLYGLKHIITKIG